MKGVGANKFSPKGSYQRQKAFMTMYRIWKAIDEVTMEPVTTAKDQEIVTNETMNNLNSDIEGKTIAQLKSDIQGLAKPEAFSATISGTSTDSADMSSISLKYDVYYKGTDIRIDTYWYDNKVAKVIYNSVKDATYTEMLNGEKVMYLKWVYEGVTTETWYSLRYFVPMKFHQKWLEDGGGGEINWKVDSLFDIPSGLVPVESTDFQ